MSWRGALLAAAGLVCPSAAMAQAPPDLAGFRILDSLDPCQASRPADEITVCARRDTNRYRLPFPGRGRAALGAGYVRGEAPRASADPTVSGPCGMFQGQRHCNEAEMAEFGYGGGRDPITLVASLATRLFDPDADIGTPPSVPD